MTMQPNNGTTRPDSVEERLEGMAAPLHDLLADIEQERVDLRDRLRVLDDKAKRVARTIKALEPDAPRPTKRKPNTANPRCVEQVLDLLKQADDGLTHPQLVARSTWSDTPVRSAIERLREDQLIRLAGTRRSAPGARPAKVYKIAGAV